MIAAGAVLVLFQAVPPAPTPTAPGAPLAGQSTPVPAGGSLQDFARKRRELPPSERPRGSFLSVPAGSVGRVRYEKLTIRPAPDGLVFEGNLLNFLEKPEWISMEIHAKRRDGTVARDLIFFDHKLEEGSATAFRQVLRGRVDDASSTELLRETAGVRIETQYGNELTIRNRTPSYAGRGRCLVLWTRVIAQEEGLVEVHVQNNCREPVRAEDTWFHISHWGGKKGDVLEQRFQRLAEDVPALEERQRVVKLDNPREGKVSVSLE